MKDRGKIIPITETGSSAAVSLPVKTGQAIEGINPLSKKELTDVIAGKLCGCAGCRAQAAHVLDKNPLLTSLDYPKARDMWRNLRSESRDERDRKEIRK